MSPAKQDNYWEKDENNAEETADCSASNKESKKKYTEAQIKEGTVEYQTERQGGEIFDANRIKMKTSHWE